MISGTFPFVLQYVLLKSVFESQVALVYKFLINKPPVILFDETTDCRKRTNLNVIVGILNNNVCKKKLHFPI